MCIYVLVYIQSPPPTSHVFPIGCAPSPLVSMAPDAAWPTRCERTWSWWPSPARCGWCLGSASQTSDGETKPNKKI